MFYTTVVQVLSDGDQRPLRGMKVSLFDKDSLTPDDLLGTGETDEAGEARFHFTADRFVDLDEHLGGEFPELYAVVHAPDGSPAVSTRAAAIDNLPRRHLTVCVPVSLVQEHGWSAPA